MNSIEKARLRVASSFSVLMKNSYEKRLLLVLSAHAHTAAHSASRTHTATAAWTHTAAAWAHAHVASERSKASESARAVGTLAEDVELVDDVQHSV